MFVPFESLSPNSRIWIFQANRPFSPTELKVIEARLEQFTEGWAAHGAPLKTSFAVKFKQFIILAADESHEAPSGCSIDSSVRVLKELENEIGVELFDRSQVAFKSGDGVLLFPLKDLKSKFQEGVLSDESPAFDNLVGTKSEFDRSWIAPAGSTWLRRYIPSELVKVK